MNLFQRIMDQRGDENHGTASGDPACQQCRQIMKTVDNAVQYIMRLIIGTLLTSPVIDAVVQTLSLNLQAGESKLQSFLKTEKCITSICSACNFRKRNLGGDSSKRHMGRGDRHWRLLPHTMPSDRLGDSSAVS